MTRWRRHALSLLLTLAVGVLGALHASSGSLAAQQATLKDSIYISPTWGYVIRWHSNEWTVTQDDSAGGADTLVLTDSLGNAIIFGGWSGFGGDAESCLASTVASAQQDPSIVEFTLATDATGEPYEWRTPEQAYAVYLARFLGADGLEQEIVLYTECQTLVPGDAVFSRAYTGPREVFDQWYDDIVDTLESVFLPPSAWLPQYGDGDLSVVWAGIAPLATWPERINAIYAFDSAGQPQLLVGLEDEAGETHVVSFQNVSSAPVTVRPEDVSLTLIPLSSDLLDWQEWPLTAARWEDGGGAADGSRVLAPGERATALLDFATGDLSALSCEDTPYLSLGYLAPDGVVIEIAESALPAPLSDCPIEPPPLVATGRPVFTAASTLTPPDPSGMTRERLIPATEGQLDALGRIPLARYTVNPGATTPDLPGPFAAFIEAGTFDMVYGESVITVHEGDDLTAPVNAWLSLRNLDEAPGSVLVLPLAPSDPFGTPVETNPAPGVTVEPLLSGENLADRFSTHQFTLDRVSLPPGASLALSGDNEEHLEQIEVLVERGSALVAEPDDAAGAGTILVAGMSRRVPVGTTITATPDQAAELLLVEVLGASTVQPPDSAGVTREPLMEEISGRLDELGRIPLVRLTMPSGTSFADLPDSPLALYVESGAVDVLLDNVTIPVPAGETFSGDSGAGLIVRTGEDIGATLLLLVPSPPAGWTGRLADAPPDWVETYLDDFWEQGLWESTEPVVDDPLEGVEAELLLPEQVLADSLAEYAFTVERVTLPPDASFTVGDREESVTDATAILVESGSVTTRDATDPVGLGEPAATGESRRLPAGTAIAAAADQETELLLVKVRKA